MSTHRPPRSTPALLTIVHALGVVLLGFFRPTTVHADTASVVATANAFKATLSSAQVSTLQISYTAGNAEQWTNLPGTRNGLRLGTLSSTQLAAALTLVQTALSDTGYTLFSEIRAADDQLAQQAGGYGSGNYYLVFCGEPATTSPWLLQVLGHHLAYNITYNGTYVSATPQFDGTEPPYWTSNGVTHAPLEAQRAAVAALADAIQADGAVASAARLSGTFTDVVHGSNGTNGRDTNFPQVYPTGTTGRGVLYTALSDTQKALVLDAIEAWVSDPETSVGQALLDRYELDAQLAETYVGYGVGTSGTASFPAQPSGTGTQHSYLRIDGPRVWIEFVVQQGVVYPTNVHYHTVWRDKVADYGAEFGQASTYDPGSTSTGVATVTVATDGIALAEGGGKGKVVFTRAGGDSTAALTVGYSLAGTATNGADYGTKAGDALSGSITIPAGASTAKLKIYAFADGVTEGTEKIKLTLAASSTGAYTVGSPAKVKLQIVDAP